METHSPKTIPRDPHTVETQSRRLEEALSAAPFFDDGEANQNLATGAPSDERIIRCIHIGAHIHVTALQMNSDERSSPARLLRISHHSSPPDAAVADAAVVHQEE